MNFKEWIRYLISTAVAEMNQAIESAPTATIATPVPTSTVAIPKPAASPTATVTDVVTKIAETEEKTGGNIPWLLIAGVALAVLILVLLVLLLRRGRTRRAAAPKAMAQNAAAAPQAAAVSGVRFGYSQIQGDRENQEDACAYIEPSPQIAQGTISMAVVCDGMGGMDDGQIASSTAVRTLTDNFAQQISQDTPQNTLLQLCARAQTAVRSYNERGGKNAGCTLVAVVLNRDDLSFISVGDSRICLQRGGALLQLNREHVLGPESDERTATQGTAPVLEPARRRAITSHIGKDVFSKVDRNLRPIKLLPGDKLLLMSDGLFGALSDDEIRACLQDTPQQDAQRLTAAVAAKQLRGQDNATVVVVAYN